MDRALPFKNSPSQVIFAPAGIATPEWNATVGAEVPRFPGDTGSHLRAPEPFPKPLEN